MASTLKYDEFIVILREIEAFGSRATVAELHAKFAQYSLRTLQYRLKSLLESGDLERKGKARAAAYHLTEQAKRKLSESSVSLDVIESLDNVPLLERSRVLLAYVQQPLAKRKPVGYDIGFLEAYRPNKDFYLSEKQRINLAQLQHGASGERDAGTYARQLLSRLLIDLSWNSSRLEGNTYSALDTQRLINFGESAEGKQQLETQMILNHKDAIEYIVEDAEPGRLEPSTIRNLHALLSYNLLADDAAPGRLRTIEVGIGSSVFYPLAVPQLIEEYFEFLLVKASQINNPYEQAFFLMVHLPYLQPFDDVNKRVSRIAANIPFIKANLSPLSFIDVSTDLYIHAVLGVYERNDTSLLADVFVWSYQRSVERYRAVRQTLGEPNSFKLQYREQIRHVVQQIILNVFSRQAIGESIERYAVDLDVVDSDRKQFRIMVENELLALHEGNYARYRVTPSQFDKWQLAWQIAD